MENTSPGEKVKEKINSHPNEVRPQESAETVVAVPKIVALANATQKPGKISGQDPVFPIDIARNYQGKRATVKAMLLINQKGAVEKVKLLNSPTLPKDLEESIVSAFMQWTYSPAQQHGAPVKVWIPETIKFSIGQLSATETVSKQDTEKKSGAAQSPEKESFSLNEVGVPPVKISGKDPSFSRALRKTYAGRRATVQSELLIDEAGIVLKVKTTDNIPEEIKMEVVKNYKTWKYKPALRANKAVKVWLPVTLKISFKH